MFLEICQPRDCQRAFASGFVMVESLSMIFQRAGAVMVYTYTV